MQFYRAMMTKTGKKTGIKVVKTATKSILLAGVIGGMLSVTACQSVKNLMGKRADGSLDYQQSKKLAPLQLPINQPNIDFVPLYPTPAVPENTLNVTNSSGKQYQLPKPKPLTNNP